MTILFFSHSISHNNTSYLGFLPLRTAVLTICLCFLFFFSSLFRASFLACFQWKMGLKLVLSCVTQCSTWNSYLVSGVHELAPLRRVGGTLPHLGCRVVDPRGICLAVFSSSWILSGGFKTIKSASLVSLVSSSFNKKSCDWFVVVLIVLRSRNLWENSDRKQAILLFCFPFALSVFLTVIWAGRRLLWLSCILNHQAYFLLKKGVPLFARLFHHSTPFALD